MVAKRDYRFITLDVLELAAQTPDRTWRIALDSLWLRTTLSLAPMGSD